MIPTELIGGGDTMLHYHLSDRIPTHDTLVQLQRVANIRSVSSDYEISIEDDFILCNTTSNSITITLPPVGSGRFYIIKKRSASNVVTVITSNSVPIDGTTSQTLTLNNQTICVKDIGVEWLIVARA